MARKKLLYIGNKLAQHGKNPTSIEILGPLLESEGFEVTYSSSSANKAVRLLSMLFTTLRKSFSVNFVLVDTYSTSNFWYAVLVSALCRALRLRYIPLLHGGNLPHRIAKNPGLARFVFAHSFRNVAPSAYLRESFERSGFKVTVIPNPLLTQTVPAKRSGLRPRLLWVRSFSSIYNPEMAVDVATILSREYDDAALCMVGPDVAGNLRNAKEYAQGQNANVSFTGRLSKPEWMEMARDYDFFLNTSNVDNTPFSLIEAASLGLAIVSTDVGGIPFLFEDKVSAALVPAGDAEQMAARISRLIRNPSEAETLCAASTRLAESFRWENVGRKWLEILE